MVPAEPGRASRWHRGTWVLLVQRTDESRRAPLPLERVEGTGSCAPCGAAPQRQRGEPGGEGNRSWGSRGLSDTGLPKEPCGTWSRFSRSRTGHPNEQSGHRAGEGSSMRAGVWGQPPRDHSVGRRCRYCKQGVQAVGQSMGASRGCRHWRCRHCVHTESAVSEAVRGCRRLVQPGGRQWARQGVQAGRGQRYLLPAAVTRPQHRAPCQRLPPARAGSTRRARAQAAACAPGSGAWSYCPGYGQRRGCGGDICALMGFMAGGPQMPPVRGKVFEYGSCHQCPPAVCRDRRQLGGGSPSLLNPPQEHITAPIPGE